ncbi:MAG: CTP synthase [Ignavibacteria bacterium GWF2_33_9]|nr:MAG: CTP synthase [Ignavibacteria bacterium GWF2_33_9]
MSKSKLKSVETKYIFITGGVLSSLGKGIASSSIGLLLKKSGYTVTIMKLDPYINVDPGTMNPFQHGEVYVTDDGAETDLDLGHYERFLGESLFKCNNTTTGQVYFEVISKERRGEYLGKTVQVIPHITDEIKKRVRSFEGKKDFVIVEIGGTVGDIESLPFLESQRQIAWELGSSRALNIHLTYVPYIKSSGEVKTKPTQHSVKILMEHGIKPDILLCRAESKLHKDIKQKIGLFCNVEEESVIDVPDAANTIYEVPLAFKQQGLHNIIAKKLGIKEKEPMVEELKKFVEKIRKPAHVVDVALVGKYVQYRDSYKSIIESFIHAGSINNTRVNIHLINSEEITQENFVEKLSFLDGILVGPGFGKRGIEGKILAINYARTNNIPFFGICLGMQCAVIEFARNICNLKDAHSSEFAKTTQNVIDMMEKQKKITNMGGTMRLGAYPAHLNKGTLAYKAYGSEDISERHRHRYEVNNEFRQVLLDKGLIFSATSPDGMLVEIVELPDHPWFVGVQFHPELKSRAITGHPLFIDFIKSSLKIRKAKQN